MMENGVVTEGGAGTPQASSLESWIGILERSGIIILLEPYFTNMNSCLLKTPKLYFTDTGLCSYLTRWSSPSVLEAGSMSGATLETFVMTEA